MTKYLNTMIIVKLTYKTTHHRTFLVVQWLRICLPMQRTEVQSLVCEDPTCHRTTKPYVPQLPSLHTLEPELCNKRIQGNKKPMYHNWRVASTLCN